MKPFYLRLDDQLDAALRAELELQRKTTPETTLADLARDLLRTGIVRRRDERGIARGGKDRKC